MTFFVPTDEELKKAGAVKATYNDNQRYTFLCEKVTVKDRDDGQLYVLTCKVIGGENDGVEEPLFFNLGKTGGFRAFCELSSVVLDSSERTRETYQPSLFVGRKWSAKASNNRDPLRATPL